MPSACFDLNDYSIPHRYVRRTLTIRADLDQVRMFVGAEMTTT
ncbi:Mu transposase domain-containing protein [Burkholderia diffusa]